MSNSIGPKIGGNYDQLRDGMVGESQGKIVRGDSTTGQIYLHHGFSENLGLTGGERRTGERNQGGEVVFNALVEKFGGGDWGRDQAEKIFNHIGKERGRDLREEFKVSDFGRIDNRIIELRKDRLDDFSRNWSQHVEVPDNWKHMETKYVEEERVHYGNDYDEYRTWKEWVPDGEHAVLNKDLNQEMRTRIRERLDTESNFNRDPVSYDRVKEIIGEERDKIINR